MIDKLPYWSFALFAGLFLAAHHVGSSLPSAYGSTSLGATGALLAAALAGIAGASFFDDAARALPRALTITALLTSGAAYGHWAAFAHGPWHAALSLTLSAVTGLLVGLSGALALRAYGLALSELGTVTALLNPLRLALLSLLFLGSLCLFPVLGLLRTGAVLGAVLSVVALLTTSIDGALELDLQRKQSRFPALPLLGSGGALLAASIASSLVPSGDVLRHSGDILYVLDGPRGHHVVTRAQGNVLLFTDGVLTGVSTDQARFAEALVHPALATTPTPRRVLLLSAGTGSVEREILRYRSVTQLTSVVPDLGLSSLARRSAVLAELVGPPLEDARLVRVESEAAPFVTAATQRYDVILADFGDPTSYREGKYFTRLFLARLRALLEPHGTLALQLTSPLRTPQTHGSLLATLRAAGFQVRSYRAPLPTLGEWGFALAVVDRPLPTLFPGVHIPAGTTFVTDHTLAGLFALSPEPEPEPTSSRVNYLHDQPAVELYHREETALWK